MRAALLPLLFLAQPLAAAPAVCDAVTACRAPADNRTDAAPALSACVAPGGPCSAPGSTLSLAARAAFRISSLDLSHTVNLTLSWAAGSGLYAIAEPALYPLQPQLPPSNMPQLGQQFRAVLFARNASGLTLEGPASALLDGAGAAWWANASRLPHQRPKLVEVVDSSDVTVRGLTFSNSPFWSLHAVYCARVSFLGVTVLAPRAIGNTDGVDASSCTDVTIDSCHIDVGDDGISIKSDWRVDPATGAATLLPTARVLVRNTTVLSRNIAIGSSCFGNITDVRIEGGRIGDDYGSSPWAFKVKTHVPLGGVVANVTVAGTAIGSIAPNSWQQPSGGAAFHVEIAPYNSPAIPPGVTPAATRFVGIALVDLSVRSAVAGGDFTAEAPFAVENLTLSGVRFGRITGRGPPWACKRVHGLVAQGVVPPLPPNCFA
jgi:polygalacturonase